MTTTTSPTFAFRKAERLKSRKQIAHLFSHRQTVGAYPLRVFFALVDRPATEPPIKIGFSVSKRTFKQAVKRNRHKRLMLEVYRLHKHGLEDWLLQQTDQQLHLMLLYVGKEEADYETIQKKYLKLSEKLQTQLLLCLSSDK